MDHIQFAAELQSMLNTEELSARQEIDSLEGMQPAAKRARARALLRERVNVIRKLSKSVSTLAAMHAPASPED